MFLMYEYLLRKLAARFLSSSEHADDPGAYRASYAVHTEGVLPYG